MMLEISEIYKSYHRQNTLARADLTVALGECVGIVGYNGRGETALLFILAGAQEADQGSILHNDREAPGYPRVFAEEVTYVPRENPFIEELTVRGDLLLWYRGSRKQMEPDLKDGATSMLGVDRMLDRTAGKLSGGMKKRLSVARALSNHAPVPTMDEPGAALDLGCKEIVWNYLRGYMTSDGAVILTSHELAELALCAKMYILKGGVLREVECGLSVRGLISRFRQIHSKRTAVAALKATEGSFYKGGERDIRCTKCGAEQEADMKFCTQRGTPMGHEDRIPEDNNLEPADKEPASGVEAVESEESTPSAEAVKMEKPASGAETVKAEEPVDEVGAVKAEEPAAGVENVKAEEPAPAAATVPEKSQPNKKFIKVLAAVIAFAAVTAVATLAYVKMTTKDPKQVVIDAFENAFPEGQAYPSGELFGLRDFAETVKTADNQDGLTFKMGSCSGATANAYTGNGLHFEARDDKTNGRSSFSMGVIYSGMDPTNLNAYYGDDTPMLAIPELSIKVFTVNPGEGLADRIRNSPTVRPLLEQNGVDVEGMVVCLTELMDEAEKAQTEGRQSFDVEALINRYKEGCKAQKNPKAALTIERAAKGTYTADNAQVSCKGYNMTINKDSIIGFLRQFSDSFFQDKTLEADLICQLEITIKMSGLMGGAISGTGVMPMEEMQQQSYEEVKKMVDQMIEYLDKVLTDVNVTVYVDKKGHLTAVEDSTNLYVEDTDVSEKGYITLIFSHQLQDGTYLTQNVLASIALEDATDTVSIDMAKQGSCDESVLTGSFSLDLTVPGDETYNFIYTSTYDSKDGSHHLPGEVEGNGSQLVKISTEGTVGQLEKGKFVHVNTDSLETSITDDSVNMVLSGEYYYQPLEGEISSLEGETMDMLSTTEEGRTNVGMEMLFSTMGLGSQMGVSMY